MSALLPDAVAAMVEARAPRRSILVHVETTVPTMFWLGRGPLTITDPDDPDRAGKYSGAGILKSMPSFKQLTMGTAQRVEFTLFAKHPFVQAMIAQGVKDVEVNLAYVFFNEDWSLAGPPAWLWNGLNDVATRDQDGIADHWVLSAIAGTYNRRRAGRRYWSDVSHQSRHPGDLICSRMSLMSVNTQRKWPN